MPAEPLEPEAPTAQPPAAEDPQTEPTPAEDVSGPWPNWLYTGPDRIYSHIPATVTNGDIVTWHSPPADDGCWTRTDEPTTKLPDNHRPEPEPAPTAEATEPAGKE